jgi:hypothetical protein
MDDEETIVYEAPSGTVPPSHTVAALRALDPRYIARCRVSGDKRWHIAYRGLPPAGAAATIAAHVSRWLAEDAETVAVRAERDAADAYTARWPYGAQRLAPDPGFVTRDFSPARRR